MCAASSVMTASLAANSTCRIWALLGSMETLRSNDNIHLIYVISSFRVLIPGKIFLTFTRCWFNLDWFGFGGV